jgi:hypothetical protein
MLGIGIVFALSHTLYADEASEAILELLIKKGVVTQQEAKELKSEVKEASFLSTKGYKVDIKGGAEVEFVDIQDDDAGVALDTTSSPDDSENPRLQVDKVTLRFTVQSEDENIGFSSELELDEGDDAFFDDAYIFAKNIEMGPTTNFLKVGLLNRFFEPKKVFESFPLSGFAWWEDEEFLFVYGGELNDGWLYWRTDIARANELDDKAPTENGQFELIHDDRRAGMDNTDEIGNSFAGGGGIGVKFNTEDLGKFDILAFGRSGKLTDDDVSWLQGLAGYSATETNDDYSRAGVNLDYKLGSFGLRAQFMYAKDGVLDRKGWYIEPYYKIPVGWKYLKSITPAVQISFLDVDLTDTPTDARTWDREKYTFGFIFQINKNLKWISEYSINEEDTGGADVNNNEFISQLKFSF